jgi:hypothetical protein
MRTALATLVFALLAAAPAATQPLTERAADPADVQTLDGIIAAFYDVVSGPAGQPRDWGRDSTLYTAGVRFVYPTGAARRWAAVDHATYARDAGPFLEGGFFEREIHRVVNEFGGMAQVFTTYAWTSPGLEGPRRGRGINAIQLVREDGRWWITHAQWIEESPERPIPVAYLPGGG